MKHDFHERKQRRIDNAERLAEKNRQESTSRYKAAGAIGDMIPFGQPILVGHHSEKRHRRDIERIDNNMRKSVEASNKAKYYDEKAEAIASNNAISSDDPEALQKLRAKLEDLTKWQEFMKAANKILRNKKLGDAERVEQLMAMNCPESAAMKLLLPDFANRIGFSYQLTNNNGNMKRIADRIKRLESIEKLVTQEITIGPVKLVQNVEANRMQILFPDKPSEEVRKELKSHGFRWSPMEGAWQRHISNAAQYYAKQIVTKFYGTAAASN